MAIFIVFFFLQDNQAKIIESIQTQRIRVELIIVDQNPEEKGAENKRSSETVEKSAGCENFNLLIPVLSFLTL